MFEGIMQSTCEKALIVEQYPRTSIIVTVQEMQDRGNVRAVYLFLFFDNSTTIPKPKCFINQKNCTKFI